MSHKSHHGPHALVTNRIMIVVDAARPLQPLRQHPRMMDASMGHQRPQLRPPGPPMYRSCTLQPGRPAKKQDQKGKACQGLSQVHLTQLPDCSSPSPLTPGGLDEGGRRAGHPILNRQKLGLRSRCNSSSCQPPPAAAPHTYHQEEQYKSHATDRSQHDPRHHGPDLTRPVAALVGVEVGCLSQAGVVSVHSAV